jgi:hypothetical protein
MPSFQDCLLFNHHHHLLDEITSIAAANIGWDILALMAKNPLIA